MHIAGLTDAPALNETATMLSEYHGLFSATSLRCVMSALHDKRKISVLKTADIKLHRPRQKTIAC